MNRRQAITSIGLGGGSALLFSQVGCGGASVSGTVTILTGAVAELKILFPANALLGKIVSLATDFNKDWVAGNFDSARTLFDNLDTVVGQVISDLGVNATTRVKLLLAAVGIALRTIAAMIQEQGQNNSIAARRAGVAAPQTVSRVNQLADPAVADRLLNAVKH